MSGVRGPSLEERRNRQETLELALRKSRLVVETDFAGRKKRDGKCAGRVQQVPGTCSRGRKKWGPGVSARCGPRMFAVEDGGDEAALPSPFLFPSLSSSSPFFLLFFHYIRLAQINRANEWSSAWGPWPVSAIFSTTSPRLPVCIPRESGRNRPRDGIRPSWTFIHDLGLRTANCERRCFWIFKPDTVNILTCLISV